MRQSHLSRLESVRRSPAGWLSQLLLTALLLAVSTFLGNAQVPPDDETLVPSQMSERLPTSNDTAVAVQKHQPRIPAEELAELDSLPVLDRDEEDDFVDTTGIPFFRKVFAPVYPNPERAAAMSFVLPGAGQFYNKKFWWIKVPVIYGGYTALIISGEFNRTRRNRLQTAYLLSLRREEHEFTGTALDSPQRLLTQRDRFDKNFQLSYIGVGIFHLVQCLEAYTSAHLMNFDIDESLSFHPVLMPTDINGGTSPGLGMVYTFGSKTQTGR